MGIELFQIIRKVRTLPRLRLFITSFALSIGWRLLSEVLVLQFLHQLLLVGVVLVELDEVGDSVSPRLIVLDFGWRHALESLVDWGCQLDHVALLLGLKFFLSRGLAWILSHTKRRGLPAPKSQLVELFEPYRLSWRPLGLSLRMSGEKRHSQVTV